MFYHTATEAGEAPDYPMPLPVKVIRDNQECYNSKFDGKIKMQNIPLLFLITMLYFKKLTLNRRPP